MTDDLIRLKDSVLNKLRATVSLKELEELHTKVFGRNGEFTAASKKMSEILPEERAAFGKILNSVKTELTDALEKAGKTLRMKELSSATANEWIDVTADKEPFLRRRTSSVVCGTI
ncbi:hypothetical protein CHS0354_035247 [Potamilus streckersoni]|uniref:Phenylalanine-tRNA ligase class II N-terminal domain-containing protein n=1 Tax=Potamilus streckersoni TaxID=2493646 RepID=A0AAE0S2H5_9BIVA|nr:hypothetical protein CHS0354_035247 [Potamilus streckersoni]